MTDRWKRIVPPLAGVGLVVGFVLSLSILSNSPGAGDSGAKVARYFASHHGRAETTAVLFTYAAGMALVYFIGMAAYLRRCGSQILAALTTAGGIVMATGMMVAAGTLAATIDRMGKLDDSTLQTINQLGSDLPWIAVVGGSAIATLSIGIASLRTQAFPKALGIITVAVGVVGITGIGSWFALMGTGPLTLALAYYLYERTGRPETITMPDVPAQRDVAAETPKRRSRTTA